MTRVSILPRFIAASGLTNLADGVATVLWAWVATLLTREPLLVALLPVALRLPWFVFAVPAGLVTDRTDRRRLILAMDIVRAVAFALATAAVVLVGPLPEAPEQGISVPWLFWMLAGAALVVGGAEVFRDNAAQTLLPALVPHADLERANGRLWSVELVGNAMLGPALGAFLIAAWLPLPFALNATAFGLAALVVASFSGRFRPAPSEAVPDWRRELGEAYRFLRNEPLLMVLALATGLWNLFDSMMMVALVLYVQEVLGLGAPAYGTILAASAVGGILAGQVAGGIVARFGPSQTAQVACLLSGLAFIGIAFAPNGWVLALLLAAFEFVGLTWNTVSVSYRQRRIPDVMLGRVNSLYRMLAWGMMPIGFLLSGALLTALEGPLGREAALSVPTLCAGIGIVVLTLAIWRRLSVGFEGVGRS